MATDEYKPQEIEPKWQKFWLDEKLYQTDTDPVKKKRYVLDMFPYPSGDGLHVGHVKIYTASDVVARYLRMKGFAVLHPTGWDAFGLPTENSAIKYGVHPAKLTEKNIDRFRQQMRRVGLLYDWDREVNTTDPEYYKWTQWIFLQLYKLGLAYEATVPINWCPKDKTGLANEEVVDGKCERCGTPVVQKPMRQWLLRITRYADQLLNDLGGLEWPKFIMESQRNWIGRKEGINITYKIKGTDETITCFTTRPDTNFGATFVVLAPEHKIAGQLAKKNKEVADYIDRAAHKTERERMEEGRDKTGVFTGYYVVNQLTKREMPVWISDFVIGHFGTGAVVGVPGHDKRDFEFAKKFELPIIRVVVAADDDASEIERIEQVQEDEGKMINSGFLDGMNIHDATERMKDYMQQNGYGKRMVTYSLRDWVFSRQRYWGEPIPIIHCDKCGAVPVPEDQLPVKLPEVEKYEPTGTGESPLAQIDDWVNVRCPTCSGMGKRETNTMPQWAGSSWYFLRYVDPNNKEALAGPEALKRWLPVDLYIGGAEHAVLHLLYARFWTKVLADAGALSFREPFLRLRNVGLVIGEDGQKMSKSRGNVINPDDVVAKYGADTLRIYEMFMGPFDGSGMWSTASIAGAQRFLKRVWGVVKGSSIADGVGNKELETLTQQTIKRVSESTEKFSFNTAIAALMEMLNELEKSVPVPRGVLERFVLLLSPYAPHLTEELWQYLGHKTSVLREEWPVFDERVLKQAAITIPVQVNGRLRGTLEVVVGAAKTVIEEQAWQVENVGKYLEGKQIVKVIFVPNKLINFVVK
ncbi:MAG: leucine--tRNA ligase [Candidatus Andersenbacteria bacterium]|nr:leucine--tRNA ligase [bacterium]MDZ4225856.1 leucine--tRNA ligase [Candidatus Andersenbacteria bacterium]